MKGYIIAFTLLSILLSGCKKECPMQLTCKNFGTWDEQNCKCVCQANYTGDDCGYYSPPCGGKGTVIVYSSKGDPYEIRLDYSYKGNVSAYSTRYFADIPEGSIHFEATQASGYIFYPSVYTGNGVLTACGSLSFSF